MKRLMVILAMVCSSVYIFASELVVKGNIDAPFSVFINGEKYYSYKNEVNVGYLPSGCYNMEIYTEGACYELLYDYSIEIPRNSTVYATFTGDDKMYITTEKDAPAVVINLTPYPKRVYHATPAPKSAPHKAAPVSKPASHKAAPAPKAEPKKASPAPKASSSSRPAASSSSARTKSTATNNAGTRTTSHTSRSTVSTRK